ncbi:DUF429 domain-containing protein [Geoglobus acetivorans]|uniref:DUF429 domain-containing protein n=1 Tax=Geoglobus acetivorans TaxID=565033 RepID=A0A0A7GFG1_GEOAI|nr:hypothetical protein GACE_0644 [Geoglobus acetivorans]
MWVAGIDVGLRKSVSAVIDGRKAVVFDDYRKLLDIDVSAVGIDAPLSFPEKGGFRECERKLLKMGIRLFPSGAGFLRRVGEKGMEIAEEFRRKGVEVYEVYPYATRTILDIAPEANKRSKDGLDVIKKRLHNFLIFDTEIADHNQVDALISALAVKLYLDGRGRIVDGIDGAILIPEVKK